MTIYCVGRNYVKHAQELGNDVPTTPLVFLKALSSLRSFSKAPVAFPQETFHHEAELVLHIREDLKLGDKFELKHIESLSLGIDLTRREVQNDLKARGLPWTLSKSFAGSAIVGKKYPFGPYAEMKNIIFELSVNGEKRQVGETAHMIFPFDVLGEFINSFSPLKKGDLIFTGTPHGVGEIRSGDSFEMKLAGENAERGEL